MNIFSRSPSSKLDHPDQSDFDEEVALEKVLLDLGLTLNQRARENLSIFVDLLEEWSKIYNLTSIHGRQALWIEHVFDSLAIVPSMAKAHPKKILDVGTGAGLPGVILALAFPDAEVFLNERTLKKAAFLRHLKGTLKLDNVLILADRIENVAQQKQFEEQFDAITCRAFCSLFSLIDRTFLLMPHGGFWWAMKGPAVGQELQALLASPSYPIETKVINIKVPFLNAERKLIQIEKLGSVRRI